MEIQSAPYVKCIMGIIYANDADIHSCIMHLGRVFGPVDLLSKVYDFDITDYYENEMGKVLKRQFVSFKKLIEAQQISEIKRISNIIEENYAINGSRYINLDPGYLDMDKFVLASAKYGRQKIYLDKGIYADPTLYFFKKEFHAYSWSFPDFSSGVYNAFFYQARLLFKKQMKTQ
jgi:hypothetical protein